MTIKFKFNLTGLVLLAVCTTGFSLDVKPHQGREGYSFFGAGFDILDYEENTTPIIAGKSIDVETDSALNFTQQSGAYVAIDDDWGFYLVTSSTLGESSSAEEWLIDEVRVRTNKVSFERQRLGFLASHRMSESGFLLFGAQYGKNEFKRFAAKLTPQAADYGIDETTFSAGTVSENVWDLSLVAGYESSTIFNSRQPGWRHQLQLTGGIPLYTNITNTDVNEGSSFSESFNGFQLRLNWVYGYQFNDDMILAFSFDMGYSQRDAISRDFIDDSGATEFPESNLLYIYPSVLALWSF